MAEGKEMRLIMVDFLKERMKTDDKMIVLDADLAKADQTYQLKEAYPDRFLDVGISEANMASMAAGLASCGFKPFIFSFCPFVTRRIADQIAVSIAYPKLNVKLVGSDPGITAQLNGATHLSVEDVGVVRSIPNMVIFEPADGDQYAKALPVIADYEGPLYIRQLRKLAVKSYFADADYRFDLFKADLLKSGTDVTLFVSGIETEQAMEAAQILAEQSVDVEVINVHTMKPPDVETIARSAAKTRCAVVCENHNIIGGLGSGIAELLALHCPTPLEFVGIRDRFGEVGKMPYLLKRFEMDAASIVAAVHQVLKRK